MLSLKHLAVNSFNENIVYLHKNCDVYKVDDIKDITKVEVHGGATPIFAFLEIVDDETIVAPNQLGLNTEAFEKINLPEGANVSLTMAGAVPSKALKFMEYPPSECSTSSVSSSSVPSAAA